MLGFQRLAGLVVWSVLVVVQWFHVTFIAIPAQWWLDNVVSTAEESTKATVREYFSLFGRVINGIANWLVALFVDRSLFYRGRRHQAHKRSSAWKEFIAHSKKRGTFNAVIEQEGLIEPRGRSPSPSPRGNTSNSNGYFRSNYQSSSTSSWWWPSPSSWFTSSNNKNNSTSNGATNKRNFARSSSGYGGSSGMKRSGSDLFNRPSGFAVAERMDRRGLSESIWLSVELAIESVFSAFRSTVSAALFLRATPRGATPQSETTAATAASSSDAFPDGSDYGINDDTFGSSSSNRRKRRAAPTADTGLRRTRSFGSWEDMGVWTASDVILQAGYPLEEHVVTTSDGYILTMQRIPRKDSKEVVFFMHGILDTSLGWVSNGTQGSQAFAAYDRGADVFLGNCRANPPRAHADASRSGAAYWCYSINELGMEDVAAQVYRIHAVKTAELGHGAGSGAGSFNMASVVGGNGAGNAAAAAGAVSASGSGSLGSSGSGLGKRDKTQIAEERENISAVKMPSILRGPSPSPSPRPGMHKRSGSDSALAAVHNMKIATDRLASEEGAAASAPPNEQQIKAFNLAAAEAASRKSADSGSTKNGRNKHSKQRNASSSIAPTATTTTTSSTTTTTNPKSRLANLLVNKLIRTHSGPAETPTAASKNRDASSFSSNPPSLSTSPSDSLDGKTALNASGSGDGTSDVGGKKGLRRRASLSRLILGLREEKNSDEKSASGSASTSRESAARRLKSFKLPHPVHEEEIEEHGDADTTGDSPRVTVLKNSPFQQNEERNEASSSNTAASSSSSLPLRLPILAATNQTQTHSQQQQQQQHLKRASREATPDIPATPVDSTECTPRCATTTAGGATGTGTESLQADARLMTPDRVSVGGREQAPLQWASQSRTFEFKKTDSGGGGNTRQSSLSPGTAVGAGGGATTNAAMSTSSPPELYNLQAVGHSLGGAALIIYAVMCKVLGRQHHLSRLVLLTPGGFHRRYPKVALPFIYILPVIMKLLNLLRPGVGAPAYIPSSLLRYITFKLTVDLQHVPALNELTRAGLRLLLNGDASEWDRALQMPHYAVASMPAISLHTGSHLMQLMSAGKFNLYDYGSVAANKKHYGSDVPPDVAAHYHVLQGLPIDLVAGRSDGVIAREDVETHYEAMKAAGLEVTLKELDVGHLDVTFAVKDEVQHYVMSRLRLNGNGLRNGGR